MSQYVLAQTCFLARAVAISIPIPIPVASPSLPEASTSMKAQHNRTHDQQMTSSAVAFSVRTSHLTPSVRRPAELVLQPSGLGLQVPAGQAEDILSSPARLHPALEHRQEVRCMQQHWQQ